MNENAHHAIGSFDADGKPITLETKHDTSLVVEISTPDEIRDHDRTSAGDGHDVDEQLDATLGVKAVPETWHVTLLHVTRQKLAHPHVPVLILLAEQCQHGIELATGVETLEVNVEAHIAPLVHHLLVEERQQIISDAERTTDCPHGGAVWEAEGGRHGVCVRSLLCRSNGMTTGEAMWDCLSVYMYPH